MLGGGAFRTADCGPAACRSVTCFGARAAAIRRVLLDNAANYRKDHLQRRVLSAGLSDGLLSAEGEQWRLQRRVLAPMFARKTVIDFAPAMLGAARALIERWEGLGDDAMIDVAARWRG